MEEDKESPAFAAIVLIVAALFIVFVVVHGLRVDRQNKENIRLADLDGKWASMVDDSTGQLVITNIKPDGRYVQWRIARWGEWSANADSTSSSLAR